MAEPDPQPDPPSPSTPAGPVRGRAPHRRWGPGFIAKLVVVALVEAGGLWVLLTAVAVGSWPTAVAAAAGLAVVTWAYTSPRAVAAKYLVPGLAFLVVFQFFVMGMTVYESFTNYGSGHLSTKADAVAAISLQNEVRAEGSDAYPVTVLARGDDLALAVVVDGRALLGTADEPLAVSAGAVVQGTRVTQVPGWQVLDFAGVAARADAVTALAVARSHDPADGTVRTQDGSTAYVFTPVLVYDAAADTFTDTRDGTVYREGDHGAFVADDGTALAPGWRVQVGWENYTAMFTDGRLAGVFGQVLAWTVVFAAASVLMTFGVGLLLAVTFDDRRVRGRRVYRSLLILPYAFPGFLGALVWRGMLNTDFGFVNQVLLAGHGPDWLGDPWAARAAVLLVNLWLGFPYMFLVCTGALQSVPGELLEQARIDGAGPVRAFRSVTLPLLLVSVAPLLVSSFAFNFNNFTVVYMLTGGGPKFTDAQVSVGATDLLISMVYNVAFNSGAEQYGLACAVSLMIFVAVGAVAWFGLRTTRQLEEI